MTDDELRQLEQARVAGHRAPASHSLTDLARDPAPEPAAPDTDFRTSTPERWARAKPARAELPAPVPRPGSPEERIALIEGSWRCLRRGVFGLIPVLGLPAALLALVSYGRLGRPTAGWNPARSQLRTGALLGALGCLITGTVAACAVFGAWESDGLALFLLCVVPVLFCLGGVQLLFSEICKWRLSQLLFLLACVLVAGVGLLFAAAGQTDRSESLWGLDFFAQFVALSLVLYGIAAGLTTRAEASFGRHPWRHLGALMAAELCVGGFVAGYLADLAAGSGLILVVAVVVVVPLGPQCLNEYHTPGFRDRHLARAWFYLLWPALVLPVVFFACRIANGW